MMLKRHQFAMALAFLLATHREAAAATPEQDCQDCATGDEVHPKIAPLNPDPLGIYGGNKYRSQRRDLQARRGNPKIPRSDKTINRAKVEGAREDETTVAAVQSPESAAAPSMRDTDAVDATVSPTSYESINGKNATVSVAEDTTDDSEATPETKVLGGSSDDAPISFHALPSVPMDMKASNGTSTGGSNDQAANVTELSPRSGIENSTNAEIATISSIAINIDLIKKNQATKAEKRQEAAEKASKEKEASEGAGEVPKAVSEANAQASGEEEVASSSAVVAEERRTSNTSLPVENEQSDTNVASDTTDSAIEPPLSYLKDSDNAKSSIARSKACSPTLSPTTTNTRTRSEPSPSPNSQKEQRLSRTSGTPKPPALSDSKDTDSVKSSIARSKARSPTLSPTTTNTRTRSKAPTSPNSQKEQRLSRTSGTPKPPALSDSKDSSRVNSSGARSKTTAGKPKTRSDPMPTPTRQEERAPRSSYMSARPNGKDSFSRDEKVKEYPRERSGRASRSPSAAKPSRDKTELGGGKRHKEEGIGGTLAILGAAFLVGMFVRKELRRLHPSHRPTSMDLPTSYDYSKMA